MIFNLETRYARGVRMTPALKDKQTLWVSRNRRKLTEIAQGARVSPQFVHQVFRGRRRSTGGRIERLLREAGAPVS